MTDNVTSLFQLEYLKKFSQENDSKEFKEALEELNNLGNANDSNQLLTAIDKLREIVFKRLCKQENHE